MLNALESLPDDPAKLKGLVSRMDQEITSLTYQVEKLKAELAGHRKARFGSRSESLDQLALDLQDDEEIEAAAEAQQAEQSSGDDEEAASNKPRAKRKHNRTPLPDHLDRQDEVLSPGEDCTDCGGSLRQIGEDVTEELEYVPGRFVVRRILRPRMACTCCETFAQAPLPSRPVERGRPGPGLLAHVLIGKYCDHLPLDRQSERLSLQAVCVHVMFFVKSEGWIDMDHKQFQEWLSGIDHLSPAQRQQTEAVFLGDTETSASLAAIEATVGEDRQCPHCGTPGAISRGKARGLRRYQCKECRKTFNAATGTPLSGLHRKDKWLSFGACLADGLTVRASAERCGLAVNTALRWRHRFLAAKDLKARKLTGIVEADETYVLESRKGARNLERKARRRGGKASKRGLSDEQVPVLVVADRSGATVSAVLPAVNADTLREVIAPVVDEDIVLVTDGHRADPRCAAAIGAHHEALNLSRSERVRGAFHIQTVNNRHSRLKDFLRRYRGVATRYLDNYLRWFQRLELENASPRACLATAIARPCIQFVN